MRQIQASNISISILVILQWFFPLTCGNVKLFEDTDFKSLLLEQKLDHDECVTLPSHLPGAVGSIITRSCILIYTDAKCKGVSIKIDQLENNGKYDLYDVKHSPAEYFGRKVSSFKRCSNKEGGNSLNVDFYAGNNIEGPAYQYFDICNCMNIPSKVGLVAPLRKINNHGNCVVLYKDSDCKGQQYVLKGGVSAESEDVTKLAQDFKSVSPCGNYVERCISLTAVVKKFKLLTNSTFYESNVAIAANTTFKNNGNAEVSQMYSAKKQVTDTIEIFRAETPSSFHDFKVPVWVTTEMPPDFPLIAKTKILSSLSESYEFQKTYSNLDCEKHITSTKIDYEVQQTIKILPCSKYEVLSFVKILENFSLQYEVYFEVSGKAKDNTQLEADFLKERLGSLDYIATTTKYSVTAKGYGSMVCNIGLESVILGEGKPIDSCRETFKISS